MSYDNVQLLQNVVNDFHGILIRNIVVPDETKLFHVPPERLQFYLKIRYNVRFFMVSIEDLEQLWMEEIRQSEDITDLVTDLTQEVEFYSSGLPAVRSEDPLTRALANAMTSFGDMAPSKSRFEVDQELFSECNSDANQLYTVLNSMKWLKVLMLIKLTDPNTILTELLPQPAAKGK